MKRRDFLKLGGAGMAAGMLPSLKLYAAHDGYTGPLWLTIEAGGGWDPIHLCDPKVSTVGSMPKSTYSTVGTVATSDPAFPIRYAPPPPALAGTVNWFSNQQFFEAHASRLLVLNGVNNRTTSHQNGQRFSWSGELTRTGLPNFGALAAGLTANQRGIPFITSGGYDVTGGLVAPTRLNNEGIRALYEIAYPDRVTPDNAGSDTYFSSAVQNEINTARNNRAQRLLAQQRLQRMQAALSEVIAARQDPGHLQEFIEDLSSNAEMPASRFANRFAPRDLYRQGRIALSAYQTGVTAAAHIRMNGFDTHGDHDNRHYPRLMDFLMGIDGIIEEINSRGLQDRVVIYVASDFARTNRYNNDMGKDHWAVTSAMLWASPNFIRGNRTIGYTDDEQRAVAVNPADFTQNAGGVIIKPAHVHYALRELAGLNGIVNPNTSLRRFALDQEAYDDQLDLFS